MSTDFVTLTDEATVVIRARNQRHCFERLDVFLLLLLPVGHNRLHLVGILI